MTAATTSSRAAFGWYAVHASRLSVQSCSVPPRTRDRLTAVGVERAARAVRYGPRRAETARWSGPTWP